MVMHIPAVPPLGRQLAWTRLPACCLQLRQKMVLAAQQHSLQRRFSRVRNCSRVSCRTAGSLPSQQGTGCSSVALSSLASTQLSHQYKMVERLGNRLAAVMTAHLEMAASSA
jgi:hypothetical protein